MFLKPIRPSNLTLPVQPVRYPMHVPLSPAVRQRLRSNIRHVGAENIQLLHSLSLVIHDSDLVAFALLAGYLIGNSPAHQIAFLKSSFGIHPLDLSHALHSIVSLSAQLLQKKYPTHFEPVLKIHSSN